MRGFMTASLLLGLGLAIPARADEQADLKAIVEKAVKASGGEEKLTKFKAMNMKMKGKFYGMGDGIDYTMEIWVQQPAQSKSEVSIEANGMKFTFAQVLNGDKGWTSIAGKTDDMDKEAVEEGKEVMYAGRVTQLAPLVKEKGFTFAALGDMKIGDHETVGVKVSSKDHRDVNLYFDKKTNLLVKSESNVKDLMAGGKEVNQETYYEDYKEVDGIQRAGKIVIKREGKDYVDGELTEFKPMEKLDDKLFDKPKD